jgi:hypothetical protein
MVELAVNTVEQTEYEWRFGWVACSYNIITEGPKTRSTCILKCEYILFPAGFYAC